MIWQAYQRVKIPIVGMGGVSTWQDAVELMLAGSTALQVGTAFFSNPYAPVEIVRGTGANIWMSTDIASVTELTGKVHALGRINRHDSYCSGSASQRRKEMPNGVFQGHSDAAISEKGKKQLALLALRCRNMKRDVIYYQPFKTSQRNGRSHQSISSGSNVF